jgi:hypothetical protein
VLQSSSNSNALAKAGRFRSRKRPFYFSERRHTIEQANSPEESSRKEGSKAWDGKERRKSDQERLLTLEKKLEKLDASLTLVEELIVLVRRMIEENKHG